VYFVGHEQDDIIATTKPSQDSSKELAADGDALSPQDVAKNRSDTDSTQPVAVDSEVDEGSEEKKTLPTDDEVSLKKTSEGLINFGNTFHCDMVFSLCTWRVLNSD